MINCYQILILGFWRNGKEKIMLFRVKFGKEVSEVDTYSSLRGNYK